MMKPTDSSTVHRRILLALDASLRGRSGLALLAELGADPQTELHGVFVEDEALLHLAALPFSREVSLTCAREQPLDLERLERVLRRQAEEVERDLSRWARQVGVSCSFRVLRGDLGRELAALGAAFDLAIVAREYPQVPGSLSRRGVPPARRVAVLPAQTDSRALALARRLARSGHRDLVVVDAGQDDATGGYLAKEGAEEWRALEQSTPQGLLALLARDPPTALVVDAGHPLLAESAMAAILGQLPCPVVLVY